MHIILNNAGAVAAPADSEDWIQTWWWMYQICSQWQQNIQIATRQQMQTRARCRIYLLRVLPFRCIKLKTSILKIRQRESYQKTGSPRGEKGSRPVTTATATRLTKTTMRRRGGRRRGRRRRRASAADINHATGMPAQPRRPSRKTSVFAHSLNPFRQVIYTPDDAVDVGNRNQKGIRANIPSIVRSRTHFCWTSVCSKLEARQADMHERTSTGLINALNAPLDHLFGSTLLVDMCFARFC
jgi:hypothetical protein